MGGLKQCETLLAEALTLSLAQNKRDYPVLIQNDLLSKTGILIRSALPQVQKVLVVTDETVARLYGDHVKKTFATASINSEFCVLECGEEHKTQSFFFQPPGKASNASTNGCVE